MAMSTITYGAVTTPRVYIDNLLLARTFGVKFRLGNIRGLSASDDTTDHYYYQDAEDSSSFEARRILWDMDPVRYLTFEQQDFSMSEIRTEFYMDPDDQPDYDLFLNLMHTSNYAAVLNHNLTSDVLPPSFSFNIGCFSVGTYLDFPFAPDLEVNIGYSHDGVQTRKTIGGKDLTHVSYSGAPDWGRLPPFTSASSSSSYRATGLTGRKSWNVKFSYIDKTDVFRAMESGSSAGSYFRSLGTGAGLLETGFHPETSILGTYLSRTLGGKLKHIFQPDNTKAEFYMVKLDQSSTSIKQLTSGAYEIGLKFVQVW